MSSTTSLVQSHFAIKGGISVLIQPLGKTANYKIKLPGKKIFHEKINANWVSPKMSNRGSHDMLYVYTRNSQESNIILGSDIWIQILLYEI